MPGSVASGTLFITHIKLVLKDIFIITRGAILRKVKRLNFGTERSCFPKISRVMAPYGHFLAKCAV